MYMPAGYTLPFGRAQENVLWLHASYPSGRSGADTIVWACRRRKRYYHHKDDKKRSHVYEMKKYLLFLYSLYSILSSYLLDYILFLLYTGTSKKHPIPVYVARRHNGCVDERLWHVPCLQPRIACGADPAYPGRHRYVHAIHPCPVF